MAVYYFYKICSLDNKYIYIGSTTNFKKRIAEHKSNCNTPNSKKFNYKLYKTIREHNGFENFIFDIIESINTDDKLIVLKREQELMIKYNSNLNNNRSFISDEDKKQYQKQYRIDNRHKILLKNNEKYICACGREYTFTNRKRHTKSSQHKKFEEQQLMNNTTNNITNNITFNITIQK
jgi:hypothetical protein